MPWTSSRVLLSTRTLKFSPPKIPGYASLPARSRGRGDPLRTRGALGAECARLQTIIIRRGRGEFGGHMIPINTSFPATARWKRRVPRGDFHSLQIGPAENEGAA